MSSKKLGHYVKSISFDAEAIQIVQGYQYKTRKDVSKTLCIIIKEWDRYSILIDKLKKKQLEEQTNNHSKKIQQAKVIKIENQNKY